MRIVPATPRHFPALLALNEEYVDVLAPLARAELELLHAAATYHRVALDERDAVAGFALAFGSETTHASVNFRWFAARYPSFLYVDRIVVATACQRTGVGSLLYRDLFAFARGQGYERVTCEVDVHPPNPRSEHFHQRFGFQRVGSQQVEYLPGRPKRVSLRSSSLLSPKTE
jgi:predicted GNAT superfamily acetyltransferase